jgi:hypothetical protein
MAGAFALSRILARIRPGLDLSVRSAAPLGHAPPSADAARLRLQAAGTPRTFATLDAQHGQVARFDAAAWPRPGVLE